MAEFATGRHKPQGKWVQASLVENVAGVQHRKSDATSFANEAKKSEKQGRSYGIELIHNQLNKIDPNAIEVYGIATFKGLFGEKTTRRHIGYLPAETAQFVVEKIIAEGQPIAGELYKIYLSENGFLDFKIIVLAPAGYSHSKLTRDKR